MSTRCVAGFILIAVGVVTLEMRDLASKVFPQTTKRLATKAAATGGMRPSKSKISQTVVVELFQTPTMRLVKELASRPDPRVRTIASQTSVTRRHRAAHSYRSCYQLSTAGQPDQLNYVLKKRRRHRKRRLLVQTHRRKHSLSFSCPHLETIS